MEYKIVHEIIKLLQNCYLFCLQFVINTGYFAHTLRIYFFLRERKLLSELFNYPSCLFSLLTFLRIALNVPGPEPAYIKEGTKLRLNKLSQQHWSWICQF